MNKFRIMIIDDDEIFLSLTQMSLANTPYLSEISCVDNGIEAQEFLELCDIRSLPFPEVIFVDINMPIMNGFDFANMYNDQFADLHPETKLVMLTSSISKNEKIMGMEIPAVTDFIEKPLTEKTLRRLLNGVVA